MEINGLKGKVMELQQGLSKLSVKVPENLSEDLTSIMVDAEQRDIPPFMNCFLEEQQEYIKCLPQGIWYHPVIIQFCLSLALKSASVYDIQFDETFGSNIFTLPSTCRISDCKNQRMISTKTL